MQIHHGKHHQAYINNLNAAIEKAPELASWSLDDLCRNIAKVPESVRGAVRNNGGGHWNHSLFWQVMAPNAGGEPGGELGAAITALSGDFAKFREQFAAAGVGRFALSAFLACSRLAPGGAAPDVPWNAGRSLEEAWRRRNDRQLPSPSNNNRSRLIVHEEQSR